MYTLSEKIKEQVRALAAFGGANSQDYDVVFEGDYPHTVEGHQAYQTAQLAAYEASSGEEKRRWYNAVLTLLDHQFDEESDLPYFRSGPQVNGFVQLVKQEAFKKYPILYAAMVLAEQRTALKHKITDILGESDFYR